MFVTYIRTHMHIHIYIQTINCDDTRRYNVIIIISVIRMCMEHMET